MTILIPAYLTGVWCVAIALGFVGLLTSLPGIIKGIRTKRDYPRMKIYKDFKLKKEMRLPKYKRFRKYLEKLRGGYSMRISIKDRTFNHPITKFFMNCSCPLDPSGYPALLACEYPYLNTFYLTIGQNEKDRRRVVHGLAIYLKCGEGGIYDSEYEQLKRKDWWLMKMVLDEDDFGVCLIIKRTILPDPYKPEMPVIM